MPKISAPSVAAHRAAQHAAVLDAAERLVAASGGEVPALGEIAATVGLARSSVYLYVSSRENLLSQLLTRAVGAWAETLREDLAAAPDDAAGRCGIYVEAALRLFSQGSHAALMMAAQRHPEALADPEVAAAYAEFEPLVAQTLDGIPDEARPILNAAIQRAGESVAAGDLDFDRARGLLTRMAVALLG